MNWLFRRAQAYRMVFLHSEGTVEPWIGEPKPAAKIVLAHLARFCRAHKPTTCFTAVGAVDPLASARMDGRREVWLIIQEHLHLDDRVLMNLQEQDDE